MPGGYWSQAVVTNSSRQYLVIESNVLTVLRPEDYVGLSVCSRMQSVDLQKCAVIAFMALCDNQQQDHHA